MLLRTSPLYVAIHCPASFLVSKEVETSFSYSRLVKNVQISSAGPIFVLPRVQFTNVQCGVSSTLD